MTPGAGEPGSSPYTLGGNDPLNRGPRIDWASLEGPDAYSNSWNRDIGSLVHSIVGDRLAYASDTQLFLGTAFFSTGVAIVGKFALPYTAMGAKAIAPALPYIAYASAGYNAVRVIGSGGDHGKLDLASDLLGLGLLSKARSATGLARTLWYTADAGINAAQGSRSVWESRRAFGNGDYLGGTLNALGAGLSFAGAFGSSAKLWNVVNAPNSWPSGISYKGTVFRGVLADRTKMAWDIHAGNVAANHRYSRPGQGALYAGTSREAALAELIHYGLDLTAVAWVSKEFKFENVLDLTSPTIRQRIGVSLESLTGDSYQITQWIGDIARLRYDGLLVPSARQAGATNLVIFPTGN